MYIIDAQHCIHVELRCQPRCSDVAGSEVSPMTKVSFLPSTSTSTSKDSARSSTTAQREVIDQRFSRGALQYARLYEWFDMQALGTKRKAEVCGISASVCCVSYERHHQGTTDQPFLDTSVSSCWPSIGTLPKVGI